MRNTLNSQSAVISYENQTACDSAELNDRIESLSVGTSVNIKALVPAVASSLTMIGCCFGADGNDDAMKCEYIKDCNNPKMPPARDTEYEQSPTPGTTRASTEIEQIYENLVEDIDLDIVKGGSLVIAPWIIMLLITKGAKGSANEKMVEAAIMSVWGFVFLALTQLASDDAKEWIVPVVLTTFIPAFATALTDHKKKITVLSDLVALAYMLFAMNGN